MDVTRRKQETRVFAACGKGNWKFYLVFNFKVERGQGLRDWQRRIWSQKGKERNGRGRPERQSQRHKVRNNRDPKRQSQRHIEAEG